jgi:hypothetical protein
MGIVKWGKVTQDRDGGEKLWSTCSSWTVEPQKKISLKSDKFQTLMKPVKNFIAIINTIRSNSDHSERPTDRFIIKP